ncbi:MAG: LamG domain-containing protein [Planctomycetota bacterium]|jgi:hypothetical protein
MGKKKKISLVIAVILVVVGAGSAWAEIDEIWEDDFTIDTISTYAWAFAHSPQGIPGGSGYAKYHHDSRDYSYLKSISGGKLSIVGNDWFLGRVFAYKTIHFNGPVKQLTLEIEGEAYQGYYGDNTWIGAAIYSPETEFGEDFEIILLPGELWAEPFENALLSTTSNEAGMQNKTAIIDNPEEEFVLVLLATDHWAWCDGLRSETYNIFDYVQIEATYDKILESIDILGPNEVAENSNAIYNAIAHYDIGNPKDVTDSTIWLVDDETIASITAGFLTTEAIDLLQDVTITAEYTEGENTQEAEKEVSILAICPTGSVLDFDGVDDYVDMGDTVKNYLDTNYTVSAWIKANTITGIHDIAVYRRSTADIGYQILFQLDYINGDVRFIVGSLGNNAVAYYPNALTTDTWYHVAGVREGNTLNVYVNGVSGTPDSRIFGAINVNNLKIGTLHCCGQSLTSFFDGKIDEVAIYNRALSAEEILAGMHTKLTGDEDGLVGYWAFDEGEGQAAGDSSLYGNDGTLGLGPDEDDSDPAWVDSDAPIGICTLEELVERNIFGAIDIKLNILDELERAMAKEQAAFEILDAEFRDHDFRTAKKANAAKAKQKIHSAIQHEEQAATAVEQSVDKLDDALNTLGIE